MANCCAKNVSILINLQQIGLNVRLAWVLAEMLWFLSANEFCGKSIRIQAFQTVCGLDKMTTNIYKICD
jgi:hypothetical protein